MKRLVWCVVFLISNLMFAQWTHQETNSSDGIYTIRFFNSNDGWAIGSSGSLKTSDGGLTWNKYGDDFYPKKISIVNDNEAFAIVSENYIYSTNDGGLSWVYKSRPPITNLGAIHFISSSTGFIGGNNGYIYKTTDGGSTWTSIAGGYFYISDLYFVDENIGWACRWGGQWSRTTDGGQSWTTNSIGNNDFYSVSAIDANTAFIAGANGSLYSTTNGGASWKNGSGVTTGNLYKILTGDGQTAWASGADGVILKTTNAGDNWIAEVTNTNAILTGLFFTDANTGWASGSGGTILKYSAAVQRSLSISQPDGGEVWAANSQQNITWSCTGLENVKIEYSTDNGGSWSIITSGFNASAGEYNWIVPEIHSAFCLIRITSTDDESLNDISDNTFSITNSSLTVDSPNGGESLVIGSYKRIYWTSINIANVLLEYSTDNGISWIVINNSVPSYTGKEGYNWKIPNTASAYCIIKISDASNSAVYDMSDNVFTIPEASAALLFPSGGENLLMGTTHEIKWTSSELGYVSVALLVDNQFRILKTLPSSAGSFNWYISKTDTDLKASAQCKIYLMNGTNMALLDSSEYFTISSLAVDVPNGGEMWQTGKENFIAWSDSLLSFGRINIYYSSDNGNSWNVVSENIPVSQKSFIWKDLNIQPGNNYRIRISDSENVNSCDTSDNRFTFSELKIVSPIGGDVFFQGDTAKIRWSASPYITNVKIQYSIDGGAVWNNIAFAEASAGSYDWILPYLLCEQIKIRITAEGFSHVNDESNTFSISEASISIINPVPDEKILGSHDYILNWSSKGLKKNAVAEYSVNNGESWNYIGSVPIQQGNMIWHPPAPGSDISCLVRIKAEGTWTGDTVRVTIEGLRLIYPSGGEKLQAGKPVYVSWLKSRPNKPDNPGNEINAYYSTNMGGSWNSLSFKVAADSCLWNVPNVTSAGCMILLKFPSTSYSDKSEVFTLADVKITSPDRAILKTAGSKQNISWTSSNIQFVKLEYSSDAGNTWKIINDRVAAGSAGGKYDWLIPDLESNECRIKISDADFPNVKDESDQSFAITNTKKISIIYPAGNENLYRGFTYTIKWSSIKVENIKIELTTNNGANWVELASSVNAADEKWSWSLQQPPGRNCKIRLSAKEQPAVVAESEFFKIAEQPSITITSPGKGDSIRANKEAGITWTARNVANVKIEWKRGSSDWILLVSSCPASLGSFKWITPENGSEDCRIKISCSEDPQFNVQSEVFSIYTPPLMILTPNGDEKIEAGSEYTIRFSAAQFVTNVDIYYTVDGTIWNLIEQNHPANKTSVSWQVPELSSDQCKVKVSRSGFKNSYVVSDNQFAIVEYSDKNWYSITDLDNQSTGPIFFLSEITGWIAKGYKLLKTTDGGTTWNVINTPSGSNRLTKLYFTDESTGWIYINGLQKIYRTINGGSTWNMVLQQRINDLFIMDANTAFVVGDEGYFAKTADGGKSWTSIQLPGSQNLISVYFKSANSGFAVSSDKLYKTINGGTNWTIASTAAGLYKVFFNDSETGYAFTKYRQFLKSTNGGISWNLLNNTISPGFNDFHSVNFISSNEGWMCGNRITEQGTVYHTVDGGLNWKTETFFSDSGYVSALFALNSKNAWLVAGNRLYKYGERFIKLLTHNDGYNIRVGTRQQIKFECSSNLADKNISIMYVTGNNEEGKIITESIPLSDGQFEWIPKESIDNCRIKIMYQDSDFQHIHERLTDKSKVPFIVRVLSSDRQYNELTCPESPIKDVWFSDNKTGYVVAGHSVYKTGDGGITWTEKLSTATGTLNSFHFNDINNGWVVGTNKIRHTTDGGATWVDQLLWTDTEFMDVFFINDLTGWVVGSGCTILKTTNGGNTWLNKSLNGSVFYNEIQFINENYGWIAGDVHGILATNDGGESWKATEGSVNSYVYQIFRQDQNTGYALGVSLYKTTNGGQSWTDIGKNGYMNYSGVRFFNSNVGYAIGNFSTNARSYILKTTNGGSSWKVLLNTICTDLKKMFFLNQNVGWIATGSNSLLFTDHGGEAPYVMKEKESEDEISLPEAFNIEQNYPNPFNPSTKIKYALPEESRVNIEVYSMIGERLEQIVSEVQSPGFYSASWKAGHFSSGIYLLRITAESIESKEVFVKTLKMLLMK